MQIEIERNPPRSSVRKFTRAGDNYTALYDPNGTLARLMNTATHQEVPAESQTFRRLADNNRGGKFKEVSYKPYTVVLQYNKAAGAYAGVRTISAFDSKKEFDAWWIKSGRNEYLLAASGVNEAEAQRLCQQQPLHNLVRAVVSDATDRRTGRVHLELAQMRMMTVALAVGLRA